MLNHEHLLIAYNSTLLNKIIFHLCQAIIAIQKQQPELLVEKYRKVQWQNHSNQSALTAKFTQILSQTRSWQELLQKLQLFLKTIFIPTAFDSPILIELMAEMQKIQSFTSANNYLSPYNLLPYSSSPGIAVLLLDAENLQLNVNTEKFLTTICTCPIQVKIAFANWSNRGKLDVELHERGYDLIHVPAGKDNADGKMIAFGSSIHERYQNTQEVLVCSSDKVMTNLCNNLQQHGLIVYQISQQGDNIKVFNSNTGENTIYNIKPVPEIPSLEELIPILKTLIKDEQTRLGSSWIELSVISQALKKKYNLTLNQVATHYFPGRKDRDIFINYPAEFVLHQINEQSKSYVTLFNRSSSQPNSTQHNSQSTVTPNQLLVSINSQEDLERILKDIMTELTTETPNSYIDISVLGSKFRQQYGKSITEQIKELKINGKYTKFLQSCSFLDLKQTNKGWEVSLRIL
ncbi:MAG TPA: NYN domain-containing protein [Nostocaceae cyanobacterium]|nr:NYN domain-containing protein [Nostocaceae cyanobacterium]